MNEQEMLALLSSSGIAFCYHMWRDPPDLPWGVFRLESQDGLYADGELYYAVRRYEIELYTDAKSPEVEDNLEQVLAGAGISFDKSEYFVESEMLYEILYDCEV